LSARAFEKIIVCATANIPLLLFMYKYVDIPTKHLSIILFVTTVSLMLLTYIFHQKIRIILKMSLPSKALLLAIYASCLVIVSLLPSMSESVFVDLHSIGIFSWVRVLSGLFLGVFLPGFTVISLFEHKLPSSLLLPTSFLLSTFINALIALVTLMFAQPFLPWILIANTLIIIMNIIKMMHNRNHHLIEYKNIILENENILMFLLFLFQLSLLVSIFLLSSLTVPNGDMWDHAFMTTRIEKGELTRFGVLTYPPFFPLHLFSVSQLSGLPPINISDVLGLFNIFIILAFYDLTYMLTNNRSVAFLSTFIFTTFGSFTFLVQAILGKMPANVQSLSQYFLQASGKTMTINSIYTITNIYSYAPVTLHFLSVLVLTSFIIKKDKVRFSYIVEAILILNLFLLHIAEAVYVLIFLFSALILGLSDIRDSLSLTLGVWLGAIIISYLPFVGAVFSIYIGILYIVALVFAVLYGKYFGKISNLFKKLMSTILSNIVRAILAFVMLFSYGVLLLIWKVLYIDRDYYISGLLSYLGAAPTYFIPIAFGLPLLISVLYFSKILLSKNSLSQDKEKILAFLGMAFAIAYLFGKAITYLNLSGYMIYRELRILFTFGGILFPTVSGLALYEVFERFKYLKVNQKIIIAVGLGFLILLNSGSTFLSATFWSNSGMEAYPINPSELQALEYLKRKANLSNVVLTFRSPRFTKVGLTGAVTINRYYVPFSSLSSSIPKFYLQFVDYIYLTKQDYDVIQKSNAYMKSVLSTLPLIFNNSEVLIFEVPQNVKRCNGETSVPIVINTDLKEASPKIALLDSLGLSYSIYDEWDLRYFMNDRIVILIDDAKNSSEAEKYIDWVKEGGQLIILGTTEGYFSQSMRIRAKEKVIFQESWASQERFKEWNFDLRGGLKMDDISISDVYQYRGSNSLLVDAIKGGILGLAYPRRWPKSFPFAIGTWFMLLENKTTIKNSLILMNGLASGVGLVDSDYSLDYYYDGGKIIYDIAEIYPQRWQKIELYFPDPNTCYVYLNDTLVFVGPRSTRYDPPEVTYGGEYYQSIYIFFVGSYRALWNGLYYAVPDTVSVDGVDGFHLGSKFDIRPKESFDGVVHVSSWYTLDGKKVAPFVFEKEIGRGKILYVNFAPLLKSKPGEYSDPRAILKSLDESLLNYMKQGAEVKLAPIEIYGEQSLEGNITISSMDVAVYGSNITTRFKLANGKEFHINTDHLIFYSPHNLVLSLNTSAILRPLHDEYVEFLIPKGTTLRLTSYCKEGKIVTYLSDVSELYNVSEALVYSASDISLIVRTPNITLSGIVTFQGAFFDIPYNQIIGSGVGSVILRGKIAYNVLISDKNANRCYGDRFNLLGSYKYDYPTLIEIELPVNILEVDFVSIVAILFYVIFIIILFKNDERPKNELFD